MSGIFSNVLKQLMRDRLPKRVLHRKKRGFNAPVSVWMRNELHEYFNRSFNDDPNLVEFIDSTSGRFNPNSILIARLPVETPSTERKLDAC